MTFPAPLDLPPPTPPPPAGNWDDPTAVDDAKTRAPVAVTTDGGCCCCCCCCPSLNRETSLPRIAVPPESRSDGDELDALGTLVAAASNFEAILADTSLT